MAHDVEDLAYPDDSIDFEDESKTFWGGPLGSTLRFPAVIFSATILYWVFVYIPVILVVLLVGDSWWWFALGMITFVIPTVLIMSYTTGQKCQSYIASRCPLPLVGGVVFAVLVMIESTYLITRSLRDGSTPEPASTLFWVFLLAGAFGAFDIKTRRP